VALLFWPLPQFISECSKQRKTGKIENYTIRKKHIKATVNTKVTVYGTQCSYFNILGQVQRGLTMENG